MDRTNRPAGQPGTALAIAPSTGALALLVPPMVVLLSRPAIHGPLVTTRWPGEHPVCRAISRKLLPAAIEQTSSIGVVASCSTLTGSARVVVVRSPSAPLVLTPQADTVPSTCSA